MRKLAALMAAIGSPAFAHHGTDFAHGTSHAAPVLVGLAIIAIAAVTYLRRN